MHTTAIARICVGTLAFGLGAAGVTAAPTANASPSAPNIVLILADDLGYDQTSIYGRVGSIATPNLEALANDGVRLASGYVASPVCSPSRSALLTGLEPAVKGADSNFLTRSRPERMPTQTIASALPDSYETVAIGKWDLAGSSPFSVNHLPDAMGFDEFYGFLGGQHNYCAGGVNLVEYNPVTGQYEDTTNTAYLTTEITNKAVDYIDEHAESSDSSPFFMYLAYNAPHTPLQTPTSCSGGTQTNQTKFSQMVTILDDGIGAVRDALQSNEIADNTIVVFLSDNGQQTELFTGPTRGGKYTLFEGGVRVPFAVTWPDGLPAGTTYTNPVSSLDLYPTLLTSSGSSITPSPSSIGVNLIPYLNGAVGIPHESLSWRYVDDKKEAGHQGIVSVATRLGDLKWVRVTVPRGDSSQSPTSTDYLFDLSVNPTEADAQNLWPNITLSDPILADHVDWDAGNDLTESFKNPRPANDIRANLPDGYIESGGNWVVVDVGSDDKSYQGTSVGLAGRSMLEVGYYSDAKVTTTVKLTAPGTAGLIVRGTSAADAFSGYVAGIAAPDNGSACAGAAPQLNGGSSRVFLSKVVNGAGTVVACQDLSLSQGTNYTIQVLAVGNSLTVNLNGVQRLVWTDSAPHAFLAGHIGLRVSGPASEQNATAQFASLFAKNCANTCQ